MMDVPNNCVLLSFSDEKQLIIEKKYAEASLTIKDILEDIKDIGPEPILLPYISSVNFENVVFKYLNHFVDNKLQHPVYCKNIQIDLDQWEKEFLDDIFKNNAKDLFDLLINANYLNINRLVLLICKYISDILQQKPLEELRTFLNITREYTSDEIQQIKEENPWCIEKEKEK